MICAIKVALPGNPEAATAIDKEDNVFVFLSQRLPVRSVIREYYGRVGDALVMEYMPWSLCDMLNNPYCSRMLDADARRRLARDILLAVDTLHKTGIVHCDIKPQNILITKDGNVRIADIAGVVKAGSECGAFTPAYAAPEVLGALKDRKRVYVQPAADAWSVGPVIYEIFFKRTYNELCGYRHELPWTYVHPRARWAELGNVHGVSINTIHVSEGLFEPELAARGTCAWAAERLIGAHDNDPIEPIILPEHKPVKITNPSSRPSRVHRPSSSKSSGCRRSRSSKCDRQFPLYSKSSSVTRTCCDCRHRIPYYVLRRRPRVRGGRRVATASVPTGPGRLRTGVAVLPDR
jgi:serine/threonine protein kinase